MARCSPPCPARSPWPSPSRFNRAARQRPLTGHFQIAVCTMRPFHSMLRGSPTFTDSSRAMSPPFGADILYTSVFCQPHSSDSIPRVLTLFNIDHIVVRNSIDQLVIRIDSCPRRHLVDHNLKRLFLLSNLFLLQIKRLLLILLANEDPNVDKVVQRHRHLGAISVSLHLARVNREGHL